MATPSTHTRVLRLIELLGQLEWAVLRYGPSIALKADGIADLWDEFAQLAAKLSRVAEQHQISWRYVLRIATRAEFLWDKAKEESASLEVKLREATPDTQTPTIANAPQDLPAGTWLMPPVSLREIGKRLGGMSKVKIHVLLDQYGLRNFPADNRQSWTVCIDPPMQKNLRQQLERPSTKK